MELPQLSPQVEARADAARNRRRVLDAAERLLAERGIEGVTMEEVAAAAGVGKGTLFRRFGSRANLARELLSRRDARLQEGFIRGPAPLGPGAPPRERVVAFGEALLDLLDSHAELVIAAEVAGSAYAAAPYRAYSAHLRMLIAQADPALDAEVLADVLLAPLKGELFRYLRGPREIPLERLKAAWRELVLRLLPAEAP